MRKIIQIELDSEDNLFGLDSDGDVYSAGWNAGKYTWDLHIAGNAPRAKRITAEPDMALEDEALEEEK
jgi:hypothetical protein